MRRRVWTALCVLTLFMPVAARAGETSVGLALTGTHGTHRESDGTARAPFVPAPIVTVTHRFNRFEIAGEGLPPIGPIRVSDNALGMHDIALTYADATLRYWNRRHTFAFGAGQTLYNQQTQFIVFQTSTAQLVDLNRSRITGMRYEAIFHEQLRTDDFLEAQVAINPSLHGRFTFAEQFSSPYGGYIDTSPAEWERASQVDANVRYVHRFGPFAVSYGVRYLNYTAAFTNPAAFADANSLVMPYVALERRWTR